MRTICLVLSLTVLAGVGCGRSGDPRFKRVVYRSLAPVSATPTYDLTVLADGRMTAYLPGGAEPIAVDTSNFAAIADGAAAVLDADARERTAEPKPDASGNLKVQPPQPAKFYNNAPFGWAESIEIVGPNDHAVLIQFTNDAKHPKAPDAVEKLRKALSESHKWQPQPPKP